MKRRFALVAVMTSVVLAGGAGQARGAGHYEMVWFRQWDRWECGGTHVFQVWVFDEDGERMGNVEIRDHTGAFRGWYTSPTGERCEIELLEEDIGVQCYDGTSTSDVSPVVTTRYGGDFGHYTYEVGFVFKPDGDEPGDADSSTWGVVPTRTNGSDDNPYTKSMVYSHQYWPNYWDGGHEGLGSYGTSHSESFVATDVNRIMGVFLFPVQEGTDPTQWRAEIHEGGPEGPTVYSKTTPFPFYFAQPLAFGKHDCIVTPGETYTVTLVPVAPAGCNVYRYRGSNYANGQYYYQGTPDATKDMFGFVYGWDAGIGTHGILRGTVTDTNTNPLVNAVVTVTDESSSTVMGTKLTSGSGQYLFNLPADTYTVDVSKPGFAPGQATGVVVIADQITIQDFVLSPLVQELTNYSFEMGDVYAWTPYGTTPPEVSGSGLLGIEAKTGSFWLGTVYPDGGYTISGGAYQRVPALAGESYQAVYNSRTGTGGGLTRMGVDPTGGTDPEAGSVLWSALAGSEGAWSDDLDPDFQVEFTASGSVVTVFVEFYTVPTTSVVAVDDVRLFRTSGPAPWADRTFADGWSLMSGPLVDSAGEPVMTVLDQVIAAGNDLDGHLHRYDTGGGAYESYSAEFTDIDEGFGYWMNLSAGAAESHSGDLPSDPVSIALGQGWNLIGQPHRYGTPVSGLVLANGLTPAWRDDANSGKVKYRTDEDPPAGWVWQNGVEAAIEWRLWVSSAGSSSNSQPRLLIRDGYKAELSYDPATGAWRRNDSGMTVTAGGVEVASGEWVVLAAPDTWHTVRLYYDPASQLWRVTVDGLTDDVHQMEGIATTETTSTYVQWGIVSSDSYTDVYSNYVYWGQGTEIDNWPANKRFDASNQVAPEVNPGWKVELSGSRNRLYQPNGTIEMLMPEAALAGWVEEAVVGYDGGYEIVKAAGGDDTSLRPWYGYWLKVNEPGLTLKIPGPAETTGGASDVVSSVRLNLDADGCIRSNFIAGLSPTASDGYEATRDVSAPPAGPDDQKEVAMGTTLGSALMLVDVRLEPAPAGAKVWDCPVQPVNFGLGECKTVTVTWDLTDAGEYSYQLVDVGQGVTTPMTPAGEYTFPICEGEALSFEINGSKGGPCSITGWSSVRDHDGVGELAIELDPAAAGSDVVSETRRDGVQKIAVDFDRDVSTDYIPGEIVLICGGATVTGEALVAGGTRLEIDIAGSVDETCCTIDVGGSVSCLTGDTDCAVRILAGDTNGNGDTNLVDMAQTKSMNGADPSLPGNARFDVNVGGSIDLVDMALVKSLNGNSATCP